MMEQGQGSGDRSHAQSQHRCWASLMVNIVESTDERFLSTEGKQISQPQVFEAGYYSSVLLSW